MKLKKVLKKIARAKKPMIMTTAHGIGKSSIVLKMAKKMGLPVINLKK